MSDPLAPHDGSTPLTDEEREGFKLSYITTRGELNAAEQANILQAEEWAFKRKNNVVNRDFLSDLHQHMFGNVWKWAGKYRQSGKNIGVEAYQIATEVEQLVNDCAYGIEHGTYEPDEIAARFHHRLVYIHPYPNGNGRHSRLAADLLLQSMNCDRFTWGRTNLVDPGETRTQYIDALRAADGQDYAPLLKFVRS